MRSALCACHEQESPCGSECLLLYSATSISAIINRPTPTDASRKRSVWLTQRITSEEPPRRLEFSPSF
jgi:hypothetical protein